MKKLMPHILAALLLVAAAAAQTAIFPDDNRLKVTLVKYDPQPAEPGGYVDVFLRLQAGSGQDLHDIKISPLDSFPFSVLEGEEAAKEVGLLRQQETAQVSFRLNVAGKAYAGSHNLRFKYTSDETFDWATSSPPFTITVKTREATLEVVSIKVDEIAQGSSGNVSMTLRNNAGNTLKDITVRLDLAGTPFATVGTSAEKKLYSLASGQEISFSFELVASPDAKNKVYLVPIHGSYMDEDGTAFSRNTTFGIKVGGVPEFQADLSRSDTFIEGKSGSLTVSIANTGLTDLRFLSVALLDTDAYKVLSVPRVYLGDLEPDDFETVEYKIFVNRPGPLRLNLSYKDAYNQQYSSVMELAYPIYTKKEAKRYGLVPPSKWPGMLMALAVIAAVIITFVRRKRIMEALRGRRK